MEAAIALAATRGGIVNKSQRWLIVASLFVLAFTAAVYSLEYRAQVLYRTDAGLFDLSRGYTKPALAPIPVVSLGEASELPTVDEVFSDEALSRSAFLDRVLGPRGGFVTVSGFYPRPGMSRTEAAIGGLLIPFFAIIAACYLILGAPKAGSKIVERADASIARHPFSGISSPIGAPLSNPWASEISPLPGQPALPDCKEFAAPEKPKASVLGAMPLVNVLFPVLWVFDLPSMLLLNRLRFPHWLFALYVLYAFNQRAGF